MNWEGGLGALIVRSDSSRLGWQNIRDPNSAVRTRLAGAHSRATRRPPANGARRRNAGRLWPCEAPRWELGRHRALDGPLQVLVGPLAE
eukprot:6714055-Pyramimonas_sp.AAC.1